MGNEYDFTREHFEAKAVSWGEFEALKRFGEYEELHDGTLMRIEGVKEFRIYCEDVEGFPIHVVTPGLQRALQEACHRRMEEVRASSAAREIGTESRETGGVRRDMILRNLQANALERQFLERTLM